MTFGTLQYWIGTKLGHINIFLEFWAQWFKKNLGTQRLAIKLEETQVWNMEDARMEWNISRIE